MLNKKIVALLSAQLLIFGALNAADKQNDFTGSYDNVNASIYIKSDFTFSFSNDNPRNGNMCMIDDEKFSKKDKVLVWKQQEEDVDCTIVIKKIDKNTIELSTPREDENLNSCDYNCGMGLSVKEGNYKLRTQKTKK